MTTTTESLEEVEGFFPLSKISSVNASINSFGWLSLSIRKEINDITQRFVFFSAKQMRDIIQLLPQVDNALSSADPEINDCIEFSTLKGDKRLVIFKHKKRLWVEVCTYTKPQYVEKTPRMTDYSPCKKMSKKDKGVDRPLAKVKNQSLALNMSEWASFRDKSSDIVNYITDLEMGVTGSKRESTPSNDGESNPTEITHYSWKAYNEDQEVFEEGAIDYYFESQCLLEGMAHQKERNRRAKAVVVKSIGKIPKVDSIMRSSYISRARQLMQRSRRIDCQACQEVFVRDCDTAHGVGCKRAWACDAEGVYRNIRSEIDQELIKKTALLFIQSINCTHLTNEIDEYVMEYDEELYSAIFSEHPHYEASITKGIVYTKCNLSKEECDELGFSEQESEDEDQDVTSEMCVT